MQHRAPSLNVPRRHFLLGCVSFVALLGLRPANAAVQVDPTLVQVARDIYPHDLLPTHYYVDAVTPFLEKAKSDESLRRAIDAGLAELSRLSMERQRCPYHLIKWESDRVSILDAMSKSDFFEKLRSTLVVSLYNQHDLWSRFGYEGSSAEYGGYIHRGFNDIGWLQAI